VTCKVAIGGEPADHLSATSATNSAAARLRASWPGLLLESDRGP
jgi:hypothetical protein